MKIFVLIDGGLGNQLFEYSFGRALSIRTGGEVVLDPWKCRGGRDRPVELHHFNIQARFTTKAENVICRLVDSQRLRIPGRFLRAIAPGTLPTVVRQKQHGFDPKIFEQTGSLFLDGWWQSELYFRDHRESILSDLSFRQPPNTVNQQWLDQIARPTRFASTSAAAIMSPIRISLKTSDFAGWNITNQPWTSSAGRSHRRHFSCFRMTLTGRGKIFPSPSRAISSATIAASATGRTFA